MTDSEPTPIDVTDVRRRLVANERALCSYVHEREDVLRMSCVAVLTREHILLVGPPGTGKSWATRLFTSQFASETAVPVYREYLLSRQATEADVLAHKCIPSFMQGIDKWLLDGHMTEAAFAFADEIFKASGSTLNGCLGWLNERLVKGHKSPLVTCFAASNEFGEDDSLKALRDRFAIAHVVGYMQDRKARLAFLKDRAAKRPAPQLQTITLRELEAAQCAVSGLPIDDAVFEALLDLQVNLEGVGVGVSDRTAGKVVEGILRAFAWLDGASSVGLEHIECLRHVLWNDPAEIPAVEAALGGVNKGIVGEIRAIVEDALRDFYAARTAYVNGSWTSNEAKRAYEDKCPLFMEKCLEAGRIIRAKFSGQVPQRVKDRARDYMEELRVAFETAKTDSRVNI